MAAPTNQDAQLGDFRKYLPDLTTPRFTTIAQNDAHGHAKELVEKQGPPWLYGLYTHWRKLLQEPFKGITNDGRRLISCPFSLTIPLALTKDKQIASE